MRVVMYVVGALGLAAVAFAGFVAMRPSTMHVERSNVIQASVGDVQPLVTDMNAWLKWSPWVEQDPERKFTVSDPSSGVGAWYSWESDIVGSGKMAIVEVVDGQKVVETLEITAPVASTGAVTYTFAPEGEGTRVTWAYDESNMGFLSKAFGVFMDMDAMLGAEMDKGLAALAPLAEAAQTARKEAERVEAERLAAEAAAVAPAPVP